MERTLKQHVPLSFSATWARQTTAGFLESAVELRQGCIPGQAQMLVLGLAPGGMDAVERASDHVEMHRMSKVSACGPLDVGMYTVSAPGAPAGKAGGELTVRATFSNPLVLLLRLRDRHHGWWPPGTVDELDRRPLELLWAESVETLTWAEMGSLLSAREQHFRSLLGATVGRWRSEPGRNSLGGDRAS